MGLSLFHPGSPQATELLWLWNVCMWLCGFILLTVTGSITYIIIRYRRRDDREPAQDRGNRKLEIAWTGIPILLVSALFALSIVTAQAVDRPIHRDPDIVVRAHQWWWEINYPKQNAASANEIHIPVQRDMLIAVESADVIHDFWVPQLGRKIDAIPGIRNFVWVRANGRGTYLGECAEFCGAQHAWMQFRVIAEDRQAFEGWIQNQAAPAITPANSLAQEGEVRFKALTCVNCHNIRGVNNQKPFAPDLTHLGSREMLAAERLTNTPANLRNWLYQPNILKPNCNMPNLKLPAEDLDSLTAYLGSLR